MLFLVVFSAKLLVIRDNPAPTPFYDQWDAEAAELFVPFSENSLAWRTMFALHNEHRVFFSRLLALDLLSVNGGQWDPRLEQVVNAAIHAFTGVLLTTILWVVGERRRLDLLVLVAVVAFALPFGWENTLLGFQSAFYFLLLFSVLALWLTTTYRPGSGAWSLGWLCAICGLCTAASGVITPVAIAGTMALTLARSPREWRDTAITAGAAAGVLAVGFVLTSPPLAHHDVFKSHTIDKFGRALAHALAWPWVDRPVLAIAMWLPLAAALTLGLLRRGQIAPLERLAAGLGLWVVLNAVALAYGRGAGGALPAIRYLDILSLGFAANSVALIALLDRAATFTFARWIALGTLAGWLLFSVVGIDRLVGRTLVDLAVWRQYFATEAVTVRQFMMSDDVSWMLSRRDLVELPYPDSARLVTLLKDPYIRRILPAAVRTPLALEPSAETNTGFVRDSTFTARLARDPLERQWLSLSNEGKKAKVRFVSGPLTCELGNQLKFEVSGYLGWKGQYLALKNLRTGVDTAVVPSRLAQEDWTEVIVPCPRDQFEIVAIDDSEDSWFGFREPVEIGWASVVAESMIRHARGSLVGLLTLAVLALGIRWT
jgi:hypothetical protein